MSLICLSYSELLSSMLASLAHCSFTASRLPWMALNHALACPPGSLHLQRHGIEKKYNTPASAQIGAPLKVQNDKLFSICKRTHYILHFYTPNWKLSSFLQKKQCRKTVGLFSRRFRRKSRLLQWLVFFSSIQRETSTFCALMHTNFYHMYLVLHFQRIQSL